MKKLIFVSTAIATILSGCSTKGDLLRLERDRLLVIEKNAQQVLGNARSASYDPDAYDFYLTLNRSNFDAIMTGFDGTAVDVDVSGRDVEFTLNSIRMDFRAGSPEIQIDAKARDTDSGVQAAVKMDARLLLEPDADAPEKLNMRIVATDIVPELRWGIFNFAKASFVSDILALEAYKYTEKLPIITLPLAKDFTLGNDTAVRQVTLPTGNGSSITGNVSTPGNKVDGSVVVQQIVFLNNGVHIFANVEGI